jgi:hypothetical protein
MEKELYLEEQYEISVLMPKPPNLIELWNNAIIQYGYIAFFSLSFPAAPLWGVLSGLFHVKLCYVMFSSQTQRPICLERDSIGIWKQIIFVYSLIALIINGAILLLTSNSLYTLLGWSEASVSDSYYIAMILISAENIIFVIKFLMSSSISGTPEWIKKELATRKVRKTIHEEKSKVNHHRIKKEFEEQTKSFSSSGCKKNKGNSQSATQIGHHQNREKSNLKKSEYADNETEYQNGYSQDNEDSSEQGNPPNGYTTISAKQL